MIGRYRPGMSLVKRLSHCSCYKLTPGYPGSPANETSWVERLLLRFVPHFDIVKTVDGLCRDCDGTECEEKKTKVTTLYLRRFYLWRSKWIGKNWGDLYLHHILRSDDDPDPHDHPWGFRGIVLKGGYLDETWFWLPHGDVILGSARGVGERIGPGYEIVRPGSFIKRRAEHIHRVILPQGHDAWTLIKTQGYGRDWNFITKDGPVFWRKYLKIDGEYGE